MRRSISAASCIAVAAIFALPAAAAVPSGPVDYELENPPADAVGTTSDDETSAWTVDAFGLTIEAGNLVLNRFELNPKGDGNLSGVVYTDDDIRTRELDVVSETLRLEGVARDQKILPGIFGTEFVIDGTFLGADGESLEITFVVESQAAGQITVVPEAPFILESQGAATDPLGAVRAQRNAGSPDPALREGNAINAATGNLYRAESDVPEVVPSGLHFTRHYNSRSPLAGKRGWTHTYSGFVDTDVPGVEQGVLLVRPDGEGLLFYDLDTTGGVALAERLDEIPAGVPAVGTAQFPLEWTGSGWKFLNDAGALELYGADGKLQRIIRRNGFTQKIERDASGLIEQVSDNSGRTLRFDHEDGRLVELVDPAGKRLTYGYDSDGRLVSVQRQDETTRAYHYGEDGAPADSLTGITDANGDRFASWQYDGDNRVVVGERAGGAGRVELEYLADGRVRVLTENGGERTYSFTRIRGKVLPTAIEGDVCNDCGKAAAWEYNELGLPIRVTDPRGIDTTHEHDIRGLETRRTDAAGTSLARTVTTDWDAELRLPLAVNEPGKRTEYSYDGNGRLLSRTEIDTGTGRSRTTTRSYHSGSGVPGRLLAEIDGPRTDVDDVVRFEYDGKGNRVRRINALGHVTEFTRHDEFGRRLEVVDPNGLVTELAYEARGRLKKRDVGGEVTTFEYDAVGNLVMEVRPDGSSLQRFYDAARRLAAIEDERGNRIEFDLDAAGNRTEERVLDGHGTPVRRVQRTFDRLGRVTEIVGAAGQVTIHSYDANGNRVSTTDPEGNTTTRTFDFLDRLTRVVDPMGGSTGRRYDAADRLVGVTDPRGLETRFEYNGFGDRTAIQSPDSGGTAFEYDAGGNVVARIDTEGNRTEHAYDALNRLARSDYPDGLIVDYRYDEGDNGVGRLTRISEGVPGWPGRVAKRRADKGLERGWRRAHAGAADDSGFIRHGLGRLGMATGWRYDRHGRVLERRQEVLGKALVTRHAYDAAGRRVETVYPGGTRVGFTHDTDELTAIEVDGEPLVRGVSYEPFGPVSGWIWGDDEVHERTFGGGRLIAQTLGDGRRTLTYTGNGRIASIAGPRLDRTYRYDPLDRLTEASDLGSGRLDRYAYDANGNRSSRTLDDQVETYTVADASNRLEAVVGAREAEFAYDANGNLVADGEHRYGYSARGRLVNVDEGKTASYRHNALGQRVFKRAELQVDFLALAEKAEAKGEALAEEAAALRGQAREAEQDAADARRRAADARAERNRAKARLERAEAEASFHRRIGNIWQRISDRFAERAERLRDRIVEPARSWWQRLRNWIYRWLASIYEYLAERFAAFAEHRFAKAEAAEERAAGAQLDLARAEARLAEAERQLEAAERRAQRLRAEAADKQAAADEQFRRAAKFRRLAEEGATRTVKLRFAYGEDGRLLGRYTARGRALREYIYLGDIPVGVLADGKLRHVHADHLGTPRLVSEPGREGKVIWSWISAPFGDTAPDENPDRDGHAFEFNLRFPGHYFDAETGWHQVGVRNYVPGLGRYASAGAPEDHVGLNPFVYAGNDPVGSADGAGR